MHTYFKKKTDSVAMEECRDKEALNKWMLRGSMWAFMA